MCWRRICPACWPPRRRSRICCCWARPSEKALLLPDAARHKAVWQTVSNPGVLLQAGAVAGVWRQSAQGKGLALRFTLFAPLSSAGRAQVQALAQRYAAFRGQPLAACTLEE